MPVPARRLPTGTIVVDSKPSAGSGGAALYARVSSHDQRGNLDRQIARLTSFAADAGLPVAASVTQISSGVNGRRPKLTRLLADASIPVIVVEHRDRPARIGVEYVEAALSAQGRRLVVADPGETTDDLVRDMSVPVRPRSDPRAGSRAGVALWCGPGRVQLGSGRGQGEPRPAGGRTQLRHSRRAVDSAPVVVDVLAAQGVERAKGDVAPWWADNSKEAYACGLERLAAALKNWNDSRKGKRKGSKAGFPRFRSKRKTALSVRFTTGTIRLDGRTHVVLPRLGRIKTCESTRKLARRIEAGTARIASATVREEAGRWFVSFSVHVERAQKIPARPDAVIGVDLGVKTLAVFSDGRPPAGNPKHLAKASRKLRRLSRAVSRRRGPDKRIGQRPSNRWLRADAARNRMHHRVAALRKDAIHKLTTSLAREYGTIVVEDLNVAGMVRNRRLARAISDAGVGEIRRQLVYKTVWNGGRSIVADRWFRSSKTCSACGAAKAKLPLHARTFTCEACGLTLDRDENAARNLAALAANVAQSCGETLNAREAGVRPTQSGRSAVKREPPMRGTPDRKVTAA